MVQKRLYVLQELDWDLAAFEKELSEVRAKLADDSAVTAAAKQAETLTAQLDLLGSTRRKTDRNVQELEEKLKIAEAKLYGGSVTNTRELAAYEEERKIVQTNLGGEQDKLLELMVQIEDLQSTRDAAEAELERLQAERGEEYADLTKREEELGGSIDELRTERKKTIPEFPASALSVYESLLKARGGHAVAKVERGLCQACRISLSIVQLNKARTSSGIVQCSSCRRILYVV